MYCSTSWWTSEWKQQANSHLKRSDRSSSITMPRCGLQSAHRTPPTAPLSCVESAVSYTVCWQHNVCHKISSCRSWCDTYTLIICLEQPKCAKSRLPTREASAASVYRLRCGCVACTVQRSILLNRYAVTDMLGCVRTIQKLKEACVHERAVLLVLAVGSCRPPRPGHACPAARVL